MASRAASPSSSSMIVVGAAPRVRFAARSSSALVSCCSVTTPLIAGSRLRRPPSLCQRAFGPSGAPSARTLLSSWCACIAPAARVACRSARSVPAVAQHQRRSVLSRSSPSPNCAVGRCRFGSPADAGAIGIGRERRRHRTVLSGQLASLSARAPSHCAAAADLFLLAAAGAEPAADATVAAVGGALLLVAAAVVFALTRGGAGSEGGGNGSEQRSATALPEDAVLVVGATGKLGREVVRACLAAGRHVVAAGRSDEGAIREKFADIEGDKRGLFFAPELDVSKAEALEASGKFQGVSQVVYAAGPSFGRQADGSVGFSPGGSPQEVDSQGMVNLVKAAQAALPRATRTVEELLPMRTAEDMQRWQRLDDVIMGGNSSSGMRINVEDGFCTWSGTLVMEGGGFCGARTLPDSYDLSKYDGVCLRVKAQGQRFKLNLKTESQVGVPESTYQACFDTAAGDWTAVFLPWHEFRCVKRASYDRNGPPLDPSRVCQIGIVYSRFEFNGLANPFYSPGPFQIAIDGGISCYKEPRPQFIQVSSAGVERNAYIADNEAERAAAIPIIQLNPGGILNFKYEGENALRASNLVYTIVRPTGLNDREGETKQCGILEAYQGDTVAGKISRFEVAQIVVQALALPSAVGKTFEARRSESEDCGGKTMTDKQMLQLFLGLHTDKDRAKFGVQPFPRPFPYIPPAPPASGSTDRAVVAGNGPVNVAV